MRSEPERLFPLEHRDTLNHVLSEFAPQAKRLLILEGGVNGSTVSRAAGAAPLRVLIADDSSAIRRVVRELVSHGPEGFLICGESADGQDALQKAAELLPDVVLLDLSIPVLSGLDTARIFQKDYPATCVVLMSAQEPDMLARIAAAALVPYSISKSAIASDLHRVLAAISRQKDAPNRSAA